MGGLLGRIAMGLGKAAETFGTTKLEEQREARLAKVRENAQKSSQAFSTSEREERQKFVAGESKLTRDAATTKTAKVDEVYKSRPELDEDGNETGNQIQTMKGGSERLWNRQEDTYTDLGKGKLKQDVDPADIKSDKEIAAELADSVTKTWGLDSSDVYGFKDEDKYAAAIEVGLANAEDKQAYIKQVKEGGARFVWDQQQKGSASKTAVPKAESSDKGASLLDKIISDRETSGSAFALDELYSSIIKRKTLPQHLRDEAQKRLDALK